jgi:Arc/MetJ-type ribon-helix-helix transcriptional regulator
MSEQIAVRIPDELSEALEDLVASGRFETKAEAVRTALEALLDAERRRRLGDLIAEGYRRLPQGDGDDLELDEATTHTLHGLDAEENDAGLEW